MSKRSSDRYRAKLADVALRVDYAFYSGEHENPYQFDDWRYPRFAKALQRTLFIDAEMRDLMGVYGDDVTSLVKREIPKPGPVVTI